MYVLGQACSMKNIYFCYFYHVIADILNFKGRIFGTLNVHYQKDKENGLLNLFQTASDRKWSLLQISTKTYKYDSLSPQISEKSVHHCYYLSFPFRVNLIKNSKTWKQLLDGYLNAVLMEQGCSYVCIRKISETSLPAWPKCMLRNLICTSEHRNIDY